MEKNGGKEAQQYVWDGAIPLQIHLHDSEVTTLPPPAPALILAPRIGYLPLLSPQLKPFFSDALPPGVDTVWFDYKGLPLKWYIPTGVLFDLLCAEPERPWNLTVHFRGYPGNVLIPCDGEDSVKWSYINSLKEVDEKLLAIEEKKEKKISGGRRQVAAAATGGRWWRQLAAAGGGGGWRQQVATGGSRCVAAAGLTMAAVRDSSGGGRIYNHGSSKNVMNMSQADQVDLWRSVMNGKLDIYNRISSKLKLGIVGDDFSTKLNPSPLKIQDSVDETEATAAQKSSRIPVRLYLWNVDEDFDNLEEEPQFDSWDQISYINRPVEINGEGKYFTLLDAVKSILPEFYPNSLNTIKPEMKNEPGVEPEEERKSNIVGETSVKSVETQSLSSQPVVKLLRIQGIEPKSEIPFSWVVKNLMNPDYFLHICLYIKAPKSLDT